MVACALTTYSYLNVSVVLAGNHEVSGVWEGDDAVVTAPSSDIGSPLVGADGEALMSISADRTAIVTLRLKPSSPTNAFLRQKLRDMKAGQITPFAVRVFDTNNGEGGAGPEALIQRQPNLQHGGAASVREWVLFVGCWEETQTTINTP
jgi:hypothetical protein